MLNFKHPNVMSLIGVCLDGEMPLIIMPFMSNGSVLEVTEKKCFSAVMLEWNWCVCCVTMDVPPCMYKM